MQRAIIHQQVHGHHVRKRAVSVYRQGKQKPQPVVKN